MIQEKDIERLLRDSKQSTLTSVDELSFIRLMLRCLVEKMSYQEALEAIYVQLGDQISGE